MTLTIHKGRRKTFDIEYIDVTEENMRDVADWCDGVVGKEDEDGPSYIRVPDENAMNTRQKKAYVGDVVVRHLELNTFKCFSKKAFDKSYESVVIRHIARDSATGEIITETEAKENPSETTIESVELPRDADPS